MEEQKEEVLPQEYSSAQAAVDLKKMLEEVVQEIACLDILRRTLLTGAIRQQSRMSIEDWLRAAESLATLMQDLDQPGRIEDTERRQRIVTMLDEWKERLGRLASCFQTAARLAGKYVKKPDELAASLQVLAEREQVVRRLIAEIEQTGCR